MAVVAYRTVDAALNFYNIQDECRHFNEAVMNGVNCIWDVGTTIAAWGGGAKKINNAINEIDLFLNTLYRCTQRVVETETQTHGEIILFIRLTNFSKKSYWCEVESFKDSLKSREKRT